MVEFLVGEFALRRLTKIFICGLGHETARLGRWRPLRATTRTGMFYICPAAQPPPAHMHKATDQPMCPGGGLLRVLVPPDDW